MGEKKKTKKKKGREKESLVKKREGKKEKKITKEKEKKSGFRLRKGVSVSLGGRLIGIRLVGCLGSNFKRESG